MAQYLLKLSGSNEIYNIINWSGSNELVPPSGYVFEPFVTESIDFINAINFSDSPITHATQSTLASPISEIRPIGIVSSDKNGNNVSSIRALKLQARYLSGSTVLQNHFAFEDDETLVISSKTYDELSQLSYMEFLRNLVKLGKTNHIIRFVNTNDSRGSIEFLITGSVSPSQSYIIPSGSEDYYDNFYRFKGMVVKDTNPILIPPSSSYTNHISASALYFNTNAPLWRVEFDLSTKTQVGTFYGDFYGDVKAENTLAVGNVDVATELETCDAMVALTNIDTAVKKYDNIYVTDPNFGNFFLNSGTGPYRTSIPPFIIHIPKSYWEINGVSQPFEITLPVLTWSPYGSDDTSMRRTQRWHSKIQKLKSNINNREGISIRFGGFYRVKGGIPSNFIGESRQAIKDWFIEAEFLNGDVKVHKDGSNNDAAYTFPVRLKNGIKSIWSPYQDGAPVTKAGPLTPAIAYNLILNSTDLADQSYWINLSYDRPVFCVQIDYDDVCKDCGSDTTETTELVRDDTDFPMKWHNTVTNYDPNGTPLTQLQDMEIGSIAIADRSRGQDDTIPFLGKFKDWPTFNFRQVSKLVVALSDGDGNNQAWEDWSSAVASDGSVKNEFTNIDGDMNVMYRMLNQVKLMQNLKPTLYGRYPTTPYSNEEYTSLMNIRCLHTNHTSSHSGPLETFDIKSVEFIGSGLDTNKTWTDIITCGGNTNLVLKGKTSFVNSLWMWGESYYFANIIPYSGQTKLVNAYVVTPKRISATSWTSASISDNHSIAIDGNNDIWVWGNNTSGELGLNDFERRETLTKITDNQFNNYRIHKSSTGAAHSAILARYNAESNQEVRGLWLSGDNEYGQLGFTSTSPSKKQNKFRGVSAGSGIDTWLDVSCGDYHTLAIKTTTGNFVQGTLWACGRGENNVLGLGDTNDRFVFTQIGNKSDWKYISAGPYHNFAIDSSGYLYAWGNNSHGQLGLGDTTERTTPIQVGSDTWKKVVACGEGVYGFSLGIKTDGSLWAWGDNRFGQLGLGDTNERNVPVRIGTYTDWTNVDGGWAHSIGTRSSIQLGQVGNEIYSWGSNHYAQLGLGSKAPGDLRSVPTKINNSISNSNHITHAILDVTWIGGSNAKHSDGLLTEKHKIKVSIQPMHTPYPSYYEIFTIYDMQSDGTYKKWKYKGWEKTLKVICIGGGGGGGAAPLEQTSYLVTSAGGGGGGAVSMAEFLASPMSVSGFQDNRPLFYGIPNEVDIWVGIGGYSSKVVDNTPEIQALRDQADASTKNLYADIKNLEAQVKDIQAIYLKYVKYDNNSNSFILNKTQLDLDYPGNTYNTPQDIQDAKLAKENEIMQKYADIRTAVAPIEAQIKQIQEELSKLGTNGANGGFSRFGEYLIAAGGDGGKAGKRFPTTFFNGFFGFDISKPIPEKDIKYVVDTYLIADGGKGGGKDILLKTPDTVRGKHKLYPFKASNTPNSGLSSTYLPGGNGGFGAPLGSVFPNDGNLVRNFVRKDELVNTLIPQAQSDLADAQESGISANIQAAQTALSELSKEFNSTGWVDVVYNYIFNQTIIFSGNSDTTDIYNQNAESTFYSCTGGGGGFGFGGTIYGTRYSHELGTEFTKNVAAMLPQSVKIGQTIRNRESTDSSATNVGRTSAFGAGFKLGLGGDGAYYGNNGIEVDAIYSSNPTTIQLGKNGGFPGGGGGGGIPSSINYSVGDWKDNPRSGGDGGDGVVIVIGM